MTKIIYKDGMYYDQISNDGTWINSHKFTYYIRDRYGLTNQEYVSLIDYGNKNLIPKCPICGNDLSINRVRFGFSSTCSSKCGTTLAARKLVDEGKHNFLSKNRTQDLKDFHSNKIRSFEFRCKSSCANSKKKAINSLYHLYISDIDDKYIHFGVTKDINSRYQDGKRYFNNIKPICVGSPNDIFNLECQIKLKYADREIFKELGKTEYYRISVKQDVLNYIISYINKGSTTIQLE